MQGRCVEVGTKLPCGIFLGGRQAPAPIGVVPITRAGPRMQVAHKGAVQAARHGIRPRPSGARPSIEYAVQRKGVTRPAPRLASRAMQRLEKERRMNFAGSRQPSSHFPTDVLGRRECAQRRRPPRPP